MVNKSNKNHPPIYVFLWVAWILIWTIIPFRLIRPLFFDKFIYEKDASYGYIPLDNEWKFRCSADFNPDGFRDIEFYPKKDDEFLILAVGDSLVYGLGLRIEDRFTNLLDMKLNRIRNTRVFNLGRCGENLYRNYVTAEEYRKKLNPDLIIFSLYENDLLIKKDLSDFPYPADQDVHDQKIVYDASPRDTYPTYSQRVLGTFDENTVNYSMLLDLAPQMAKDKTLYYLLTYTAPDSIHHKLLNVFNYYGYPIINNFDLYFDKYKKYSHKKYGLQVSPREFHPNSLANQMFAERLYQEIMFNAKWGFAGN